MGELKDNIDELKDNIDELRDNINELFYQYCSEQSPVLIIRSLIDIDGDINHGFQGVCESGNLDMFNYFIDNHKDKLNYTWGLIGVCEGVRNGITNNHKQIVDVLIKNGANVNDALDEIEIIKGRIKIESNNKIYLENMNKLKDLITEINTS